MEKERESSHLNKDREQEIPAFPGIHTAELSGDHLEIAGDTGMTLRDYFAAKAMQGICADGNYRGNIAVIAYDLADAMMKERNK